MSKKIIRIAITGGAGQIAYQLLFRLASGELLGRDQSISLQILEVPDALPSLEGVKMELNDCAFPLLHSTIVTSDAFQAFADADIAILIGAKPRGPGMERGDLLHANAKIFVQQGQAINEVAKESVKVFVVGNPCNTNCLIARSYASRIRRQNFFAMTRLDQNRATYMLAQKANVPVQSVSHVTIWGNHSSTQVPDFAHATIEGNPVEHWIKDRNWLENEFFQLVQQRGAAIIKARGKSSAASAAQAILDSIRDVLSETPEGQWFSAGIDSYKNPYGIAKNIIYSFPCIADKERNVSAVKGLSISDFMLTKLKASEKELLEERDIVRSLIRED